MPTVRANLEMNSHEEKLSQMIRQSKEIEAKQEMKRQAAAIKEKKKMEGWLLLLFGSVILIDLF